MFRPSVAPGQGNQGVSDTEGPTPYGGPRQPDAVALEVHDTGRGIDSGFRDPSGNSVRVTQLNP